MAKKRSAPKARAAPRRAYGPKKKRRVNTLNKSVKKPMQALGVAIGGVIIPYAGAMVDSVKTKSITPIASKVMDKNTAINAAKGAAVGFIAGTAAGIVADKTGLKKPVNKIKRTVKSFTGGLL